METSMDITILVSDLIKESHDSLIGELLRHKVIGREEALGFINEEDSEDIELEAIFEGSLVPYRSATGPSYSSGGDPAEGGYCEDEYIYVQTNNPEYIEKGQRLLKIINALRTQKYEDADMRKKAYDLRMRLRSKRLNLLEITMNDYMKDSDIEELSNDAYEQHND